MPAFLTCAVYVTSSPASGHFFSSEFRDYYRILRETEPVARVGNSIYVYYFPPAAGEEE